MNATADIMASLNGTLLLNDDAPFLRRKMARLSKRAKISEPALYLIQDNSPNAFAVGLSERDSAIGVMSGLLTVLDENQIEAVLAHEIGHIKKGHSIAKTQVALQALALSGGGFLVGREIYHSDLDFTPDDDDDDDLTSILLRLCFAGLVVATTDGVAAHLNESKAFETEYEADEVGAELSGKGWALASALQLLQDLSETGGKSYAPGISQLFITSPSYLEHKTHPPTEDRIERLRMLGSKIPPIQEVSTRFCSACGEKTDSDGKYCYWCGVLLD